MSKSEAITLTSVCATLVIIVTLCTDCQKHRDTVWSEAEKHDCPPTHDAGADKEPSR